MARCRHVSANRWPRLHFNAFGIAEDVSANVGEVVWGRVSACATGIFQEGILARLQGMLRSACAARLERVSRGSLCYRANRRGADSISVTLWTGAATASI